MKSINKPLDLSNNKLQFVTNTHTVPPPPKFFLNKHPIHLKRMLQQNEINRPLYTIVEQGIK